MIICSPSQPTCDNIKRHLLDKYKLKNLGPVRMFVGIEIIWDRDKRTIALHQHRSLHWEDEVIQYASIEWHVKIPRCEFQTSSQVWWWTRSCYSSLSTACWQADICYAWNSARYIVSTLGRFNANPTLARAVLMKRTLRYLRHTALWPCLWCLWWK